MTTTPVSAATYQLVEPPGRAGFVSALRAEWTKFWSVRSTPWSLVALVVTAIGIGALSTNALRGQPFSTSDPLRRILVGFYLGQFAIGVLGILFISAEYGTGQIRSTLSAQPRRPVVLGAKAVVMGGIGLIVGEILTFATFMVGHLVLAGTNAEVTLGDPAVIRVLVEGGVYLTLMGLIGLGLASIIRNTAGSIALFTGFVLILTLIIGAMPAAIVHAVSRYLPAIIGATVFSSHTPDRLDGTPVFSPLTGLLVLAVYAAVLLLCGTFLMNRRDT